MFVGDFVRLRSSEGEMYPPTQWVGVRGIVIETDLAWPHDRYEETLTATVQYEDGSRVEWYDWQLQVLSSTVG